MSWGAVPVMPVEVMLLPRWFPFHLSKISYWARTVIVPLLVLQALKPKAKNPKGVRIDELFHEDPKSIGPAPKAPHQRWSWFLLFRAIDIVLRAAEPLFPRWLRKQAIDRAAAFVTERLNGEDGLGAIYPAMANSVMMFDLLGYPEDHPDLAVARKSLDKLLVIKDDEAYCQPCVSPVWDTALTCHALLEVGGDAATRQAMHGLDWLEPLQILDLPGDWAETRPDVRPGGWAFQYANAYYPDLDDTAVVVMAMDRVSHLPGADPKRYATAMARGQEWVAGLQSRDGGWGAFDADNHYYYLNNIPFADHGALLDPPSADLTGRCLSMLAQLGGKVRDQSRHAGGDRMAAPRPAPRRQLVRALGHELHLRNLVGPVRAQCREHRPQRRDDAQGGGLAGGDPESRWRLGRGWHELQARISRL